jgi:cell division septum initiation protein DivIVA
MASKKPPQKPPPESKVTERLASIVDAAERTALSVIDDAEKEAKLYLEEARARADRMVAERLREEADRIEGQGTAAADGEAPRLRAVDSPPPPQGVAGARSPAPNGGSAAARLLATQMAVSGSSRREIEARLRDGFEIEDTSEILDAILGPEE